MAIPTKAKNVLLLPVTDGWVSNPFNMSGFANYNKNKSAHNGIDLGYTTGHPYYPILACQDGVVVDLIKNDVKGSRGNGIVLEHTYADGTRRWTGYIHLKEYPSNFKIGDKVVQGQQIGIRGGSPYIDGKAKFGIHLHLYVTAATTKKYSWSNMKSLVVDPFPLLYKSNKITYNKLVKGDIEGYDLTKLPILEDAIINVVEPVPRNKLENQLSESSSKLRVRMEPNLKGTIIGYLKPDVYYNFFETKNADGYDWYQIADKQWVAKTSTMTIYPKKTEVDILKEEIDQLKVEKEELVKQVESVKDDVTKLEITNEQLTQEKSLLSKTLESVEAKIAQVVSILTK